jgi:hypothetical protein
VPLPTSFPFLTPEFAEYQCICVVHSSMMSSSVMGAFRMRTSSIMPLKYSVPPE